MEQVLGTTQSKLARSNNASSPRKAAAKKGKRNV